MSEVEWLTSSYPPTMLRHLLGVFGDRKFRLFAVACCRRLEEQFLDADDRAALDVVERFADGRASASELAAVSIRASNQVVAGAAVRAAPEAAVLVSVGSAALVAARDGDPDHPQGLGDYIASEEGERQSQARLLREIVGNPFRTVVFDPGWRTSTAVALAAQMYESREFGAMSILADALQDAGCDSTNVLEHCRGPGPHVRGCWVVDMVLGVIDL
ncbi:Uncharacterized protein OS=Sorangium cellulosum (strain So ce56) GN=sce5710 PE=4 SV=1 [Gemmata massiliana]|uniref:Uncharacterized protein n=1 Tax=Gemmata massiliana TaxID=1210884 RepID=A0A6P2D4U0_9BACT|nr:hypothetical protein [Gemmata massiliana]VTR96083.1 Uncharacterized protein OS=Sorangium cellulosum (strain So ce56) GN=sce5710 PE=4 SV=1 [Gemmata massiliana]